MILKLEHLSSQSGRRLHNELLQITRKGCRTIENTNEHFSKEDAQVIDQRRWEAQPSSATTKEPTE